MRVELHDIKHDYAGTVVLTGVTASITAGSKIGLVGANGAGKTTLIRILLGELTPVSGTVVTEPGTRIGYVPQELAAAGGVTVGEYLCERAIAERVSLRAIEDAMSRLANDDESALARELSRYQAVRDRYDEHGGDLAEEQAERIVARIGLPVGMNQPLSTLSGGERNVLALGRALMDRPDLLVLDEPGNHLDFAGLAWLEQFLAGFPGAALIVSHNRYLLDRVVDSIWELFGGTITSYTGGYTDYRFTRLRQATSDQATYVVQQKTLARIEELVKTFERRARETGDAAWGRRMRARRSQLEKWRAEAMEKPEIDSRRIELAFARDTSQADIAVDVRDYSRAFGETVLFRRASLRVRVGERVGIVGPNGSGKTTFLADLIGNGGWDTPGLRIGPSLRVGYCAQHRDRFRPGTTVMDAMLTAGRYTRHEVFNVLSRLLFTWEDLEHTVDSLSGGEWNRLQLGLAIIGRATLLVLDEPTNHLDIPSREAVEAALVEFDGTIVAVSHDRYFLDAIVDRIVEIDGYALRSFDGTFTDFWFARSPSPTAPAPLRGNGKPRGGTRGDGASATSRAREVRRSRRATHAASPDASRAGTDGRSGRDSRKIEAQITALEAGVRDLERGMEQAFQSGDFREGRRLAAEMEKTRARIEELWGRVE